jgi:LPS-assembly lipoprotein
MRQLLPISLVLPGLLLLSGCGFHLRGDVDLPPELLEMALIDAVPATSIAPDLRDALKGKGIKLHNGAPMLLQLRGESYSRRVLSVDSSGRAQEYGLGYTLRFSLQKRGGEVWLPMESIIVTRDLRFDAAAVLGTANEENQLSTEMRRDAVLRILRRLQHAKKPETQAGEVSRQPADNPNPNETLSR